jgi:hypothetical protein
VADAPPPADAAPAAPAGEPDGSPPGDTAPEPPVVADAAPPVEPLDPSLVAWWKFDEPAGSTMAKDSSGHGNDGRLQALDPGRAWVEGRMGGALLVAEDSQGGRNPGVVVAASRSLEGLARRFTFAAWIRRAVARTRDPRTIIARAGGGRDDLFWMGLDQDQLTINGDNLGWAWAIPQTLSSIQQWGHVAVTVDNGNARVYVDGRAVTMRDRLRPNGNIEPGFRNDAPIVIGGRMLDGNNIEELFQGAIDDLRVYDRALSPNEIRNLAQP